MAAANAVLLIDLHFSAAFAAATVYFYGLCLLLARRRASARRVAVLVASGAAGLVLAAPALLLPAGRASAQPGPVRIIVPYTPGAFNDTLARLVADGLQSALGQLGVVENRPGASGSIGIAAAAQAAPDGTTIAVANTANLTMNPFLFANLDRIEDLPVTFDGCTPYRLRYLPTSAVL